MFWVLYTIYISVQQELVRKTISTNQRQHTVYQLEQAMQIENCGLPCRPISIEYIVYELLICTW